MRVCAYVPLRRSLSKSWRWRRERQAQTLALYVRGVRSARVTRHRDVMTAGGRFAGRGARQGASSHVCRRRLVSPPQARDVLRRSTAALRQSLRAVSNGFSGSEPAAAHMQDSTVQRQVMDELQVVRRARVLLGWWGPTCSQRVCPRAVLYTPHQHTDRVAELLRDAERLVSASSGGCGARNARVARRVTQSLARVCELIS